MAITTRLYDAGLARLLSGVDWAAATVRCGLLSTGYVFDAAHEAWADVSAREIAGTGYAAGGLALSGKAVLAASGGAALVADAVVWPALTADALAHAVLYVSGTVGAIVDPLLACTTFSAFGLDVAAEAFPINWQGGVCTIAPYGG